MTRAITTRTDVIAAWSVEDNNTAWTQHASPAYSSLVTGNPQGTPVFVAKTWNGHALYAAKLANTRGINIVYNTPGVPLPAAGTIVMCYADWLADSSFRTASEITGFRISGFGSYQPAFDLNQCTCTSSVNVGDYFTVAVTWDQSATLPYTPNAIWYGLAGSSLSRQDGSHALQNTLTGRYWLAVGGNTGDDSVATGHSLCSYLFDHVLSSTELNAIHSSPITAVYDSAPQFAVTLANPALDNATGSIALTFSTLQLKILEQIPTLANKTVDIRVWKTATAHALRGAECDHAWSQVINSAGDVSLALPGAVVAGAQVNDTGWIEATDSTGLVTDVAGVIASGPVTFRLGP